MINATVSILGVKFTASEHRECSIHFYVSNVWPTLGTNRMNEWVSEAESHLLILTSDMSHVLPLVDMKGCQDNSYTFDPRSFKILSIWTLWTSRTMSLVIAFCTYVWMWMHANVVTNSHKQGPKVKVSSSVQTPSYDTGTTASDPGEGERMRGSKSGTLRC